MSTAAESIYSLFRTQPRAGHQWIGLEVERLVTRKGQPQILHYPDAVSKLLRELIQKKGWSLEYEWNDNPLALRKNLHTISVEPGGQFEISPAPRKSVGELKTLFDELDSEVLATDEGQTWQWLHLAVNPYEDALQISLLPSPRYLLMNDYFQKVPEAKNRTPARGQEMMRLTAGLQINLDFDTDVEGVEMYQAANAIAPYLSALFSNSPLYKNGRSSALSERHLIWQKADALRSGFYDWSFSKQMTVAEYADRISKIPLMYAYDEAGKVWDPQGKSLHELPSSLWKANALAALRQIFTEVRFKPCCVEIRFLDAVGPEDRYAATAMAVGLLYDAENRRVILEDHESAETLRSRMDTGAREGLKSDLIFMKLQNLLMAAKLGCERRQKQEEKFLEPVEARLNSRKTPAEDYLHEKGLAA